MDHCDPLQEKEMQLEAAHKEIERLSELLKKQEEISALQRQKILDLEKKSKNLPNQDAEVSNYIKNYFKKP